MRREWIKLLALLLPVLTGCLSHTRKLQQPILAGPVLDADVLDLVQGINDRYDKIQSLTATMDFSVSVGGAHQGKQTDFTSFRGFVLFRKPQMLRVIIKVPVIQATAVDLASDGSTFKLYIPRNKRVVEGENSVTSHSAKPLENLRPSVFLDSIVIQNITPDEIVSVIHESSTTMDVKTKRLLELPQYDLTVLSGSTPVSTKDIAKVAKPRRVIRFSRIDLLPVEQDIYNAAGDLETQVLYGPSKDYEGTKFFSTIDITRPIDGYRIRMSVEKVAINPVNPPLTDRTFELTIPPGTTVQKLPK
jgi:outer membrane lipoprotein-sorting protein